VTQYNDRGSFEEVAMSDARVVSGTRPRFFYRPG